MENHHAYFPNKKQGSAGRLIFNLLPQRCENGTFFVEAQLDSTLKFHRSRNLS